MNEEVVKGGAGIVREGFTGREIERRGETTATALAARARAEIEARYVMAMQRPRDFADVRIKLLKACERPGFAQSAIYQMPRGDKPGRLTGTPNTIEGLSVRFAEEAMRVAGNLSDSSRVTYDDDFKRVMLVTVVDLETNAIHEKDVSINKTVERRKVKDGAVVLGQRTNSSGDLVFIVQATEEELLQKEGGLSSRTIRTLVLRHIPSDIREECEQRIVLTRRSETARDPDGARKQIADAFAAIGVMPSDLALYLGIADLAAAAPAQLDNLRGLFAAVREGEITFAEALKAVTTLRDVPESTEKKEDNAKRTQAQKLTEKIRERSKKIAEKKQGAAAPAAASSPPATKADAPKAEAPMTTGDVKPQQEQETCFVCKKPIVGPSVEAENAEGVIGRRHPGCTKQREPGED